MNMNVCTCKYTHMYVYSFVNVYVHVSTCAEMSGEGQGVKHKDFLHRLSRGYRQVHHSTRSLSIRRTAAHHNTLQHTATHSNTPKPCSWTLNPWWTVRIVLSGWHLYAERKWIPICLPEKALIVSVSRQHSVASFVDCCTDYFCQWTLKTKVGFVRSFHCRKVNLFLMAWYINPTSVVVYQFLCNKKRNAAALCNTMQYMVHSSPLKHTATQKHFSICTTAFCRQASRQERALLSMYMALLLIDRFLFRSVKEQNLHMPLLAKIAFWICFLFNTVQTDFLCPQ